MQNEYLLRKERLAASRRYSAFDTAALFIKHQRQRGVLHLLRKNGFEDLKSFKILEIGCGVGSVLLEFLSFGARPGNLYGIDIIQERAAGAHARLPTSTIACSDGQDLPFPDQSFDIVMQFMALSSVLDLSIRQNIACEMMRTVRPGGLILWYDFWTNPTNPETYGIQPDEIRTYFHGCDLSFQRITLAPPLARKLVPISWVIAMMLEKMSVFNTHYLAAIRPQCSPSFVSQAVPAVV